MASFKCPVALTKHDLKDLPLFMGAVNSDPVTLAGSKFPVRSLVFDGFAGGLCEADGLYHGEYRFFNHDKTDRQQEDFNCLPGLSTGESYGV